MQQEASKQFKTTLYKLFFTALPHLVENNAAQYSGVIFKKLSEQVYRMDRTWPFKTTWSNFELCLPLKKHKENQEATKIREYFTAIRTGTVPLTTLTEKAEHLNTKYKALFGSLEMH